MEWKKQDIKDSLVFDSVTWSYRSCAWGVYTAVKLREIGGLVPLRTRRGPVGKRGLWSARPGGKVWGAVFWCGRSLTVFGKLSILPDMLYFTIRTAKVSEELLVCAQRCRPCMCWRWTTWPRCAAGCTVWVCVSAVWPAHDKIAWRGLAHQGSQSWKGAWLRG